MSFDREIHHRRSIRLTGYDYASAGSHFVTICVEDGRSLLGEVVDGSMRLNAAGLMVNAVIEQVPQHYPGVRIDTFVVMPNHVHGIIVLAGAPRPGPSDGDRAIAPDCAGQPRGVAPTVLSLPDVVHRLKTMTTKRYTDGVKQAGWQPFPGRLWQRNYYEHIIRDEKAFNEIRAYILDNPRRWTANRELRP